MGTDYSLRRRGARGSETELAQLLARLGGKGVESRFRSLKGGRGLSLAAECFGKLNGQYHVLFAAAVNSVYYIAGLYVER